MTPPSNPPNARMIGYARVSRSDMSEERQTQALQRVCDLIHVEKASGAGAARPVFEALLRDLRAGDVLVVLDLDRAFRSSLDALNTIECLRERGVGLRILNLNLDLSTEFGEVVFGILAALAQFERRIIARRTKEGIEAARRSGKRIGRPRALSKRQEAGMRRALRRNDCSVADVARHYGVSRSTVWRVCKAA